MNFLMLKINLICVNIVLGLFGFFLGSVLKNTVNTRAHGRQVSCFLRAFVVHNHTRKVIDIDSNCRLAIQVILLSR